MSRSDPQPPLEDGLQKVTDLVPRETRDAQGQVVKYYSEETTDGEMTAPKEEIDWLQLARESYETSTEWLQADLYAQWERNIANFRSVHPPGSKYHSAQYKYRSKMFRPKTRTAARKVEAAMISALFNNEDLLSVTPQNSGDLIQQASADVNKGLVQERMTNDIPWYMLAVGGTQDASIYGSVISYQAWEYQEDENGKARVDKPTVELIPPENIRMDRAAKWTDPINDSPYLIHLLPMFIGDVLDKMNLPDSKTGAPEWKKLTPGELRAASKEEFDSLRSQRHTPQVDPKSDQRNNHETDFDTVWIHRNFIRKGGKDYVYYTAGTTYMLTKPVLVQEVYHHLRYGERPYVKGTTTIEAHKVHPDSYGQLGQNLQSIANDIANRRHDNVLLAMDKRFILRREANIDRDQLFRTVPGGGIETDDPVNDIKVIETGDVTGSAYAEQDRINMDMDDLLGQFNQGTKQQGAKGDTVGGMNMMMSDAGGMTDYVIRTLLTTWVRPMFDQLIRMEQAYETDLNLIAVAADKAQVYQKFGVDQLTDEMLRKGLTVNVNVGIGATDPQRKIDMLMTATTALIQMPGVAERLVVDEFAKEIYGAIGYQDGARFIRPLEEGEPTQKEQELMQMVEELQRKIDGKVTESQGRIDMERVRQAGQVEEARIKGEYTLALEVMKQRVDDLNVLILAEKNDIAKGELEMERDALNFQMKANQLNMQLEDERESRQMARDMLNQGETGTTTPQQKRPNTDTNRASPRVASSGAGVIMRDQYGSVPHAEG